MVQREDVYWNTFLPAFFARVSDIIKSKIAEEMAPLGMNYTHAMYIMGLTLRDGQTLVGLSDFLDIDKSNTNHVMKTLREQGLVYDDRPSPTSKKYKVFLTEKGRALGLHLMDFQVELMNGYFKGISQEEIITLRNILLKFLNNIDPDLDNYMMCRYQDPFYTYLHANINDELPLHVITHLKELNEDGDDDFD
jgi:DNA-binding MarR family transcriptional regulator